MITVAAVLGAAGVAWAVIAGIRYFSAPPAIPTHVEVPRLGGEFGGDSESPEILAVMERKPLFYTFLVFGLDNGMNADAIMVGAFDVEGQEAFLISVPRDTRVEADRRLRKPVAAYAVGRGGGRGHDGGIAQMKADMQSLFGFVADFYVAIDYRAFERMIDSVGGVTLNVPFHMRYDDPTDGLHINIPAGTQNLNGRQALQFARFRMATPGYTSITDYRRIENQQKIIRALFDELMTPRTIVRVPELIRIYREHVNTNLLLQEKIWFADQLARMGTATISTYTLPTTGTSGAPSWYELPDIDGILELVNRTVNPFTQDITEEMVNISR